MTKKFAVCFSGYPRFVRRQFDVIKKNLLDGFGDYDIYAHFQWSDDWKDKQIHHEYKDKFEVNELEEFKEVYKDFNLKKVNVIEPYNFDDLLDDIEGADPTMNLSLDKAKDVYYRMKCQFQGIYDCTKLIDNLEDYDYIVRMRTDLIPLEECDFKDLETDGPLNQDGQVAGRDRFASDWFLIVPVKDIKYLEELAAGPVRNGIVEHTHGFMDRLGKPYGIEYYEMYIRTPTARGEYKDNVFTKDNTKYTIIKR